MSIYARSTLLGQVLAQNDPARILLAEFANKWTLLVLKCLSQGMHRFSELKQKIEGVSEKMLSQTLKTLEHYALVVRTVYASIPPKVEYQLTFAGAELASQALPLLNWLDHNANALYAEANPVTTP